MPATTSSCSSWSWTWRRAWKKSTLTWLVPQTQETWKLCSTLWQTSSSKKTLRIAVSSKQLQSGKKVRSEHATLLPEPVSVKTNRVKIRSQLYQLNLIMSGHPTLPSNGMRNNQFGPIEAVEDEEDNQKQKAVPQWLDMISFTFQKRLTVKYFMYDLWELVHVYHFLHFAEIPLLP